MENNSQHLTCDPTNDSAILKLSRHCVNSDVQDGKFDCFPQEISIHFSNFAGSWCIINAFIGLAGNLLTLLAIPYAYKRKR